ncbi:type II secretion system protein [Sulfuricurvum sp.]|uniref:type II secretion system protein n=1 Tax=Sulfuricurvum sp. TaxID=2025608 RepID=UPI0026065BA5|nr:type II secretion system protein [Sulfuricurvum sp.]MDD2265530.1 type II secretion system protein [Sulfuricurvum sp.]MDD2783221.1 type II secretion system protein [Sulfuricurvum sp.]
MRSHTIRKAFTMIELLFVIVVLGIVGGIALEAIRQYYEGIYRTQEYSKRVAEADHILEQLSKYFENAISSSIVNLNIDPAVQACYGPPQENPSDFTVAFIGVDVDSLRGISGSRPGWSEETQLLTGNVLNMSDANLSIADTIIGALYPSSSLGGSAIYDADSLDANACARFNYKVGEGKAGYHRISSVAYPNQITLNAENNATDGHRKYLLRTGYAFRVDDNGSFWMYSNFRPWDNGYGYFSGADKVNLLGQNVAHFYADYNATDFMNNPGVSDRGLVWRLKVCMRGLDANLSTSDDETQTICRERRVYVRY